MFRVTETEHYLLGRFFHSEHRATGGLSARFIIDRTTELAESEEESDERPSNRAVKR